MKPRGPLLLCQPDDPGVDHDNEFAPVVFKPSLAGRETAGLGFIRLGETMQAGWDQLRRVIGSGGFDAASMKKTLVESMDYSEERDREHQNARR